MEGNMTKCLLLFVSFVLIFTGFVSAQNANEVSDAIRLMDRQWIIEAYSSKDLKDFDRIVADEFVITGNNGKMQNRTEKRESVARDYTPPEKMNAPEYIFRIDPGSHKVRVFGETAISTGFIIEDYIWNQQKINFHVYFTNVYLKRKGSWQVVQSQFTYVKQA
jgi:hypothetical protein